MILHHHHFFSNTQASKLVNSAYMNTFLIIYSLGGFLVEGNMVHVVMLPQVLKPRKSTFGRRITLHWILWKHLKGQWYALCLSMNKMYVNINIYWLSYIVWVRKYICNVTVFDKSLYISNVILKYAKTPTLILNTTGPAHWWNTCYSITEFNWFYGLRS